MEEVDKGCQMNRMGVSGGMFLLVLAHLGNTAQRAVKRLCLCVCVHVCACACACVRACVHACVRACVCARG